MAEIAVGLYLSVSPFFKLSFLSNRAVSYLPEEYGSQILPVALKCLNGEAVPPAVYAKYALIARKEVRALSSQSSP